MQPKLQGPTIKDKIRLLVQAMKQSRSRQLKNPAMEPSAIMEANNRAVQIAEILDRPKEVTLLEGRKFAGELRGMADRPFLNTPRYSEQQGRALRVGADLDIVDFERRLISRFKKLGVPLFAHCVRRSGTQQDSLFAAGLSKAKAGQSPHNHGSAVDIVHSTKAWELTRQQWELIAHVADEVARAMSLYIRWGGDWDGDRSTTRDQWDPAHFEIQNWEERIKCEHDFVRYQRDADGVMQKHTTVRCVKCGFRGFYHKAPLSSLSINATAPKRAIA